MHALNQKPKIVNADRISKIFVVASIVYLIAIVLSLVGLVKVALG